MKKKIALALLIIFVLPFV